MRREKGSFWWKDIIRLHIQYRGVACCKPHTGDTVSFWDELLLDSIFSMKYPNLHSFAKNDIISLKTARETVNIVDLFRIPMTRLAHNEMLLLAEDLNEINNSYAKGKDEWVFMWGNHHYSVKRFYQHHFAAIKPPITILWIWKSNCIPRIKFFSWLLLNDKLNTRNMLRRRNKFLEDYSCIMCSNNI